MYRLISAICTPLQEDESLHLEGLEAHIHQQFQAGISEILVAGTMGMMQLLQNATYRQLVESSVHFAAGRGPVLAGVGDTGWARTRARIQSVQSYQIDGVVVITPYLFKFTPVELQDYFRSLANESSKPLYLYDLPILTGTKLGLDTVLQLAEHPNIHGIKCSDTFEWTRQLIDAIGDRFRIIVAQPLLLDLLMRHGIREHLDGVFSLAPEWTVQIRQAAEREDWPEAARIQQKLNALLRVLRSANPLMTASTAILNARGVPGSVAPLPYRRWADEEIGAFLARPEIAPVISGFSVV